jgi:hypothetical protein
MPAGDDLDLVLEFNVIARKLEYFREGGSVDVDIVELERLVAQRGRLGELAAPRARV